VVTVTNELGVEIAAGSMNAFTHTVSGGPTLSVAAGATVYYYGGEFDVAPTYAGTIRLWSELTTSGTMIPSTVWPSSPSTLVEYFSVLNGGPALVTYLPGSRSVSGNISLISGTLDCGSNTLDVAGNIDVTSGTLTASNSTVNFNGSADQTVGASALLFHNLTLTKPAGTVILNAPVAVNGTLALGANKISTGPSTLSVISGGSVVRTSGYVIGNLQKIIGGTGIVQFEIGDGSYYTPVTLNVTTLTASGTVTARSVTGDHPKIDNSGIDASKSVNRNWSLIGSGISAAYDATFTFNSNDKDASATPSNFIVAKYSAETETWTRPTVGAKNSTSTQAMGLTTFSEFALGEPRSAPITFTVTNTLDSGPGSLRQALIDAAAIDGFDFINFNIPGSGTHTIHLLSPLPTITDPVVIDGPNQLVELDGSEAGPGTSGLVIQSHDCFVMGLVISRFSQDGISINTGGNYNVVKGNIIEHNRYAGVRLNGAGNTVGGTSPRDRNILSGNEIGLVIQGSGANGNQVLGNYIGTDLEGTSAIPNSNHGIFLGDGTGNVVGPSNVISGNAIFGVLLIGGGTTGNSVIGNYIGTKASGTAALPNSIGVHIIDGHDNIIGGSQAAERNVISGNTNEGILIYGSATSPASGNIIRGNYIGTDYTGQAAVPNQTNGIRIHQYAPRTVVGGSRNIISGNGSDGIDILESTTTGNIVSGNYIGIAADGTTALGNKAFGVKIHGSAGNTIGGPNTGDGNVISANGTVGSPTHGVLIEYENSGTGNIVQGNRIGTDWSGTLARGNVTAGICVLESSHNRIMNNVLSGNKRGIMIWGNDGGSGSNYNSVTANLIGTNANGTVQLGNLQYGLWIRASHNNTVGGALSTSRNIISGNGDYGVLIGQGQPANNKVQGNYIGLDINGSNTPLPNGYNQPSQGGGIDIFDATGTTVGGSVADARNVISGNVGYGILIDRYLETTTNNVVQGNFIGTNPAGTAAVGNTFGVYIQDASGNTIGGTGLARNIISGNADDGINILGSSATGNTIAGNYVGLDAIGTTALGNGDDGINIESPNNTVGGTTAGERNVISGNASHGVVIVGSSASGNKVLGNYIGTDADGDHAVGNSGGIWIGARSNTIGGTSAEARNIISGNNENGISIYGAASQNNIVEGNFIGTDVGGTNSVSNTRGIAFGNSATITR
jgi:parallel beta-helix repeat protein